MTYRHTMTYNYTTYNIKFRHVVAALHVVSSSSYEPESSVKSCSEVPMYTSRSIHHFYHMTSKRSLGTCRRTTWGGTASQPWWTRVPLPRMAPGRCVPLPPARLPTAPVCSAAGAWSWSHARVERQETHHTHTPKTLAPTRNARGDTYDACGLKLIVHKCQEHSVYKKHVRRFLLILLPAQH